MWATHGTFLADIARIHKEYVLTDSNLWANEEGTPILVDPVNGAGATPTRNFSAGSFEDAASINSEAFQKVKVANRACYQCALGCRQVHEAGGVKGEGPEYETIALCGSNCGVGDLAALMRFNHECDEWGLDTISSGSVVGLAMDMTESGHGRSGRCVLASPKAMSPPRPYGGRGRAPVRSSRSERGPGCQVWGPRVGDGSEEPGDPRLRSARGVRHEPCVRHVRPGWMPHARLSHR